MEEEKKVKLVAAVCTQCGAQLEVDPNAEAAVCRFCNTPFIVEKAINNYNVQHATIEHADNVTVDMGGAVRSTLDFVGEQLKESRKNSQENRRLQAETDRAFVTTFFKYFWIAAAIIIVVWFLVFGLRG